MATFKTDVQAGQTGLAAKRVEGQKVTGQIVWAEATWTVPAETVTSGDNIEIVTLPIGAIVYPELSRTITEGLGGTTVAIPKIGDSADDDRYTAASAAVVSAGNTAWTPNSAASVVPRYAVTKDTNVLIANLTHAGAPTAGKRVQWLIAFRMP